MVCRTTNWTHKNLHRCDVVCVCLCELYGPRKVYLQMTFTHCMHSVFHRRDPQFSNLLGLSDGISMVVCACVYSICFIFDIRPVVLVVWKVVCATAIATASNSHPKKTKRLWFVEKTITYKSPKCLGGVISMKPFYMAKQNLHTDKRHRDGSVKGTQNTRMTHVQCCTLPALNGTGTQTFATWIGHTVIMSMRSIDIGCVPSA